MITPEGKKNKHLTLVALEGKATLRGYERYHVSSEITKQVATIFNTKTKMWSDNSVYTGAKGNYIKKDGRKYFLKDFV